MKMKRTRKTPTGQETSITNGQLYFEDAKQCAVDSELFTEIISDGYTNSIRITSLSSNWSEKNYIGYDATLVTSINVQMTMRREVRYGRGYWYAYRRFGGKLFKRFMGQDADITEEKILEIARKMPGF
jgi:hypothetical protein